MHTIAEVTDFLGRWAPLALAEEWDNVGLLIGDGDWPLENVLTCLTLTPDVAREAIQRQTGLVVSHHPVLFRPAHPTGGLSRRRQRASAVDSVANPAAAGTLRHSGGRLTAETSEGRMLLDLIRSQVAVYSPHTGYDNAREGINQQLAELLGLTDISVLRPRARPLESEHDAQPDMPLGAGRHGRLASRMSLRQFNQLVKDRLEISTLQYVGDERTTLDRVAIACGSAAEFMHDAMAAGCQVLLTGEARFHSCLEARNCGIAMVLTGHYASERPAVERLAHVLGSEFPKLTVWASQAESDPLRWA